MSAPRPAPTVVTSLSEVRQQRLDVQLRHLEFHALLHRKLDLELLFECLLSEGQAFVAFDGVRYRAADRGADVHLGVVRPHMQHFELKLGERSLGEVILMRAQAFSAREERDAERLVESLVYPLDNALEHHAALLRTMTDPITGLGNAHALELQLPRELRLARRVDRSLAVMRIAVDQLEAIGEHHGSEVGLQAWHAVAGALKARLRGSDLIFRTDDDVFCIVLGDTSLEGALALAARLGREVGRCVSHENVQFVLGTSVGVTATGGTDTAESLLARADRALAEARQRGRDQVFALAAPDAPETDDPSAA
mgnify:CR=1 FL=1